MIKALFQLVFGALCIVLALGLVLSLAFWAMANIWMLLGIFTVIVLLLIIYGMATSDNEWVSGLTNLTLFAIVGFTLYAVFG